MTCRIISLAAAVMAFTAGPAYADGEVWTSAGASGSVGGKWRASVDTIARFEEGGPYEWVVSGSLGYQVNGRATVWVGFVNKTAYADGGASTEQRFREDLVLDDIARIGPVRVGGRLRAEERWRDGARGLGWRLRPQVRLTLPLVKDGPALVASGEGFVNLDRGAGQKGGYDRTRASLGLSVPLSKAIRLDGGYLRQWTRGADTVDAATFGLTYRW